MSVADITSFAPARLHEVPGSDPVPPVTPTPPPIDPGDPGLPGVPIQEPPTQQPPVRMAA